MCSTSATAWPSTRGGWATRRGASITRRRIQTRALIVNDRGVRRAVIYAMGAVAKDSELLFDYGDRYWGAMDERRPVEVADVSTNAAPPKRRRLFSQ
jgi:hypothetical protein